MKNKVVIPLTSGLYIFAPVDFGRLEIKDPGVYVLEIHPVKDQWNPTRLRAASSTPMKQ